MPLKAGHFSVKAPGQISVKINTSVNFGELVEQRSCPIGIAVGKFRTD